MPTGRLEAFSDGVLAILITILVLELKVPHASSLEALHELGPVFCGYVLSFIFVGILSRARSYFTTRIRQEAGQVSPSNRLPSSQSSPVWTTPSPQYAPSTQPAPHSP